MRFDRYTGSRKLWEIDWRIVRRIAHGGTMCAPTSIDATFAQAMRILAQREAGAALPRDAYMRDLALRSGTKVRPMP
jgi:hypothetical protein